MPIRKKTTKGKTKVKTTVKQAQNVRQSVKVVIEAPKPRRRAPAKPTKKDLLSGLMRAPEYTTFKDLTPAVSSTGYNSVPPPHPLKNDPQQIRIQQQEQIGSVSGSLSLAPAGLLKAPTEEEKKSNEDAPENIVMPKNSQVSPITGADIDKEERKKIKREEQAEEQRQRRAREKEAEAKRLQTLKEIEERTKRREKEQQQKQKADAFRRQRLQKDVFGAWNKVLRPDIIIEDEDF